MDGGDGRVTALVLHQIRSELQRRGYNGDFLSEVNMFSGASAGGINSLLLADQAKPDDLVDKLPALWSELDDTLLPIPSSTEIKQILELGPIAPFVLAATIASRAVSAGLALLGLQSLFSNQALRGILEKQFGERKLEELKHAVAVVAFQLDNESPNPALRAWQAQVFTNLPRSNDGKELCLDVALRTSAQPVELPVFQSTAGIGSGYIDGGYVANNPMMVSICRLIDEVRELRATAAAGGEGSVAPPKVLMLSVGAGVRSFFPFGANYFPSSILHAVNGSAPWGYGLWALNPLQPLMIANLYLQASSGEITQQAKSLLGVSNVFRLGDRVPNARTDSTPQLMAKLFSDAGNDDVSKAVDWILASGWIAHTETSHSFEAGEKPESLIPY